MKDNIGKNRFISDILKSNSLATDIKFKAA